MKECAIIAESAVYAIWTEIKSAITVKSVWDTMAIIRP